MRGLAAVFAFGIVGMLSLPINLRRARLGYDWVGQMDPVVVRDFEDGENFSLIIEHARDGAVAPAERFDYPAFSRGPFVEISGAPPASPCVGRRTTTARRATMPWGLRACDLHCALCVSTVGGDAAARWRCPRACTRRSARDSGCAPRWAHRAQHGAEAFHEHLPEFLTDVLYGERNRFQIAYDAGCREALRGARVNATAARTAAFARVRPARAREPLVRYIKMDQGGKAEAMSTSATGSTASTPAARRCGSSRIARASSCTSCSRRTCTARSSSSLTS